MSTATESRRRALGYMLLASLFFALMDACVKVLAGSLPSTEVAFVRTLVTLTLLTPYMLWARLPLLGRRKDLLLLRGLAGFGSLVLGFYAIAHIPLADVSILWKTSVVFTALFSALFFNERLSVRYWAMIALAFLGSALIIKPSFNCLNLPGLGVLAAGCLVGVVAVTIRRLHQTESSLTIVYCFSLYGTLGGLLAFGYNFIVPSVHQATILFAVGVSGTIGQIFFTRSFRYASPSEVQPYSFSEILFALFLAMLVWNEFPDSTAILGMCLVLFAGVTIARRREIPEFKAEL